MQWNRTIALSVWQLTIECKREITEEMSESVKTSTQDGTGEKWGRVQADPQRCGYYYRCALR